MRASRHEMDISAACGKPAAEIAAEATGSHHHNFHERPLLKTTSMSENLKVQLKFRIFSNFFKSSATFLKVPPEDLKLQRLFQMFSDSFECSANFFE
jgi:hypothetical protein